MLAMELINQAQWDMYKSVMRDAHDTFSQKTIVWKRKQSVLDRYQESNEENDMVDVELKVLLNYNYLRSWPVDMRTETGSLDRQSVQVLINKDYLRDAGYIGSNGYFIYNQNSDYFIIDGLKHKPSGDTPAGQMNTDDVFITIIVQRDETLTGNKRD